MGCLRAILGAWGVSAFCRRISQGPGVRGPAFGGAEGRRQSAKGQKAGGSGSRREAAGL